MNWLTELIDEFSTEKRRPSQARIDRMVRIFRDVPEIVMQTAVDNYMRRARHAFFPAVSELNPFVDAAQVEFNSGPHKRTASGDDEIYEWELRRGTMPPLGEIDDEIEMARLQVKRMLTNKEAVMA